MNKATFYIGVQRDAQGKLLETTRCIAALGALRRAAADVFGGFTLTHAEGGWINPHGTLIAEHVARLEVFGDDSKHAKFATVAQAFARRAGAMFGQGSVLLEVRAAPGVEFVDVPQRVEVEHERRVA